MAASSHASPSSPLSAKSGRNGSLDANGDSRRAQATPTKRACNECRQQKLRCDVVLEPFTACSRCKKQKLDCKLDPDFKRVGKRERNAEIEKELAELRKRLKETEDHGASQRSPGALGAEGLQPSTDNSAALPTSNPRANYGAASSTSQEEVASRSLLDLRQGIDVNATQAGRRSKMFHLAGVTVQPSQVEELFTLYFAHFHPFLPLLDRDKSPEDYFNLCPLLYWAILYVAARPDKPPSQFYDTLQKEVINLAWKTIQGVPQNYHVVKGLCLICSWPPPTSSSSKDSTLTLCGTMMTAALQLGLHRPSHTQDFLRATVEQRQDDIQDRIKTWATCNIVAQSVTTGLGQPPMTVYDHTLIHSKDSPDSYEVPQTLRNRLEIEIFADKVTRRLYCCEHDALGIPDETTRASLLRLLSQDYQQLLSTLSGTNDQADSIDNLFARAANMHLHHSVFFSSSTTATYQMDLLALFNSVDHFLESALTLPKHGLDVSRAPNYIMQMLLAAGFALLKLLNSFFASYIDVEHARKRFFDTHHTLGRMSVARNDLPFRFSEVLAQVWNSTKHLRSRMQARSLLTSLSEPVPADDSLRLRVTCRMSMSHVFDSAWRWREEFAKNGRTNLEAKYNNPTNPEASAGQTPHVIPGLTDPTISQVPPLDLASSTGDLSNLQDAVWDPFDPLALLFDSNFEGFPYQESSLQGLDMRTF